MAGYGLWLFMYAALRRPTTRLPSSTSSRSRMAKGQAIPVRLSHVWCCICGTRFWDTRSLAWWPLRWVLDLRAGSRRACFFSAGLLPCLRRVPPGDPRCCFASLCPWFRRVVSHFHRSSGFRGGLLIRGYSAIFAVLRLHWTSEDLGVRQSPRTIPPRCALIKSLDGASVLLRALQLERLVGVCLPGSPGGFQLLWSGDSSGANSCSASLLVLSGEKSTRWSFKTAEARLPAVQETAVFGGGSELTPPGFLVWSVCSLCLYRRMARAVDRVCHVSLRAGSGLRRQAVGRVTLSVPDTKKVSDHTHRETRTSINTTQTHVGTQRAYVRHAQHSTTRDMFPHTSVL